MQQFLQLTFSGITQGAVYGLIALGFSVIYGTTRLLNFAQGHFVVLGGVFTWALTDKVGLPIALAVVLAMVGGAVVAMFTYEGLVRRARNKTHLNEALLTLGVGLFIDAAILVLVGPNPVYIPEFTGGGPVSVFGANFSKQGLWVIGTTVVVLVALLLFMRRTRTGLRMLASSMDVEGALLIGVNVPLLVTFSWAISGMLGALGGAVLLPILGAGYGQGLTFALKGFTASVLGGLGNIWAGVVGGLVIGLMSAYLTGYTTAATANMVVFGLLLLMLLIRPQGLFGKQAVALSSSQQQVVA